jgi:hypothetical protein
MVDVQDPLFVVAMLFGCVSTVFVFAHPRLRERIGRSSLFFDEKSPMGKAVMRADLLARITLLLTASAFLALSLVPSVEVAIGVSLLFAFPACAGIVLVNSIMLLNWPRVFVPVRLRDQQGAIHEWIARRRDR